MTVKELKELLNDVPEEFDNCLVITPMHSDMPGMFVFEGVCPAVTEIVTVAAGPEFMVNNPVNDGKEMKAFLIAGHSFHDGDEEDFDGHDAKLN